MKQGTKQGISLIAVLMFMLAATTASIVIFRWIGSENFSSGARLKRSEAYQASQAGLESTRGWLANKGAEVGMLITQFKAGGIPVLLETEKLNLLGGQMNNSQREQNFKVYLVGVDTRGKNDRPYKLKFLSIGEARNGSKYSQIGIFDVAGLYKTRKSPPGGTAPKPPAYFGGAPHGTQNEYSSAVINGNTENSSIQIHDYAIIAGNATLVSGTWVGCGDDYRKISASTPHSEIPKDPGDFYVTGDFESQGAVFCGNVYVGGNATIDGSIVIHGDLYVNGALEMGSGANDFTVYGNVTAGESINMNAKGIHIYGNLVMPNSASAFNTGSDQRATVDGDVWIAGNLEGNDNLLTIGKANSKLYMNGTSGAGTVCKQTNIPDDVTFTFLGGCGSIKPSPPSEQNRPAGASLVSHLGDQIRYEDGKEPIVPDPIVLGQAEEWKKKMPLEGGIPANCDARLRTRDNANPKGWVNSNGYIELIEAGNYAKEFVDAVNACYALGGNWDGGDGDKWLVLNMEINAINQLDGQILNGDFIIIVHNRPGILRLPQTEARSNVLLYLMDGAKEIHTGNGNRINNYFIYSEEDIDEINGNQTISGSLFMANGKQVGSIADAQITFNDELFWILSDAGVIEENPELCKGTARDDGNGNCIGDEEDGEATGGPAQPEPEDDYYFPIAPHLKVSLQSQYANKEMENFLEDDSNWEYAEEAILVLPRVIYLGANGSAEDLENNPDKYYSVFYLNGARELEPGEENHPVCGNNLCELKSAANCGRLCTNTFSIFTDNETNNPPGVRLNVSPDSTVEKGGPCAEVKLLVEDKNAPEGAKVEIFAELKGSSQYSNWTVNGDRFAAGKMQISKEMPVAPGSSDMVFRVCFEGVGGDYGYVNIEIPIGACGGKNCIIKRPYEINIRPGIFSQLFRKDYANAELDNVLDCPSPNNKWSIESPTCSKLNASPDPSYTDAWKCSAGQSVTLKVEENCEAFPSGVQLTHAISNDNGNDIYVEATKKWKRHALTVNNHLGCAFTLTPPANSGAPAQTCRAGETGCALELYHDMAYSVSELISETCKLKRSVINGVTQGIPNPMARTENAIIDLIKLSPDGCDYEPEWCENYELGSSVPMLDGNIQNDKVNSKDVPSCFFVKDIISSSQNIGGKLTINGIALPADGNSTCSNSNKFYANSNCIAYLETIRADGGFYVMRGSINIDQFNVTTGMPNCAAEPTASSAPVFQSAAPPPPPSSVGNFPSLGLECNGQKRIDAGNWSQTSAPDGSCAGNECNLRMFNANCSSAVEVSDGTTKQTLTVDNRGTTIRLKIPFDVKVSDCGGLDQIGCEM